MKDRDELVREAVAYMNAHPSARYGQAIFTVASKHYPEECAGLTATEHDCFYNNSKVEGFLDVLYTESEVE